MRHFGPSFFVLLSLSLNLGCLGQSSTQGEAVVLVDVLEDSTTVGETLSDEPDTGRPPPDLGDAGHIDLGHMDAAVAPVEVDICEMLELPKRDLLEGTGFNFGDIAAPFVVNTLSGVFDLRREWTGCESYVFITYFPPFRTDDSGGWIGDLVWATPLREFVTNSPRNVHYFFSSYSDVAEARRSVIESQAARFEDELARLNLEPEDASFWRKRVHFVTDRATGIQGGPGEFMSDYMNFLFDPNSIVDLGDRGRAQPPLPFAFAIDREQKWDSVGSLAPVVGQPRQLSMATFAASFYNHKVSLLDRLSDEEATVLPLLDEDVTARVHTVTAMFPDEVAMNEVDTLEFDVAVTCPHRNVFACSEWDRLAHIRWCSDPECGDQVEVARWITPYWRRGKRHWILDATPFLGLVKQGGPQTFRIEMGPSWERATERKAEFSIRLRRSAGLRSVHVEKLYGGGNFDSTYNENHRPVNFNLPPEVTKAELVLILSGHGQNEGTNCAEWCDHRHAFSVNGQALQEIRSPLRIGTLRGCAEHTGTGVPPGQFGNWAPGRAYWCPGWPVDPIRIDVTDYLNMGAENIIEYSASLAGQAPGGGNISLSAYIVGYR